MRRSTAVALSLLLAVACSSSNRQEAKPATESTGAAQESRQVVPAAPPPVVVESLDLAEGAPGMRLDLAANGPLVWTSYRNDAGDLVVELPNSVPGSQLVRTLPGQGLVASVEVEEDRDGPRPLTRLTVKTTSEVEPALSAEGNTLRLELAPVAVAAVTPPIASETVSAQEGAASPAAEETELAYEPLPNEEEPVVAEAEPAPAVLASTEPRTYGTPDQPVRGEAPPSAAATYLEAVRDETGGVFFLAGNGPFTYSSFRLEDPDRLVIDLEGVTNNADRSTLSVGAHGVRRVRIAQFRAAPEPVARVVFDLDGTSWPQLEATTEGLLVRFGGAGERLAAQPAREERPAPAYEPAPAPVRTTSAPAVQEPPPERVATPTPDAGRPATRESQAEPVAVQRSLPAVSQVAGDRQATSDVELYGGASRLAPTPATPIPSETIPGGGTKTVATKVFGTRTISTTERTYYGDPITMSMRDGDLVETLRSFAAISGLSIVVQPEVKGTVTVELENIPWDQALEQILRVNKLGYELEGTVMRIAPVSLLKQEAEEQQALEAAKASQVPLKTVLRRLSYATASEVSQLLRGRGGLLSQRGSVILDRRTNTLILKELPAYMDTVIAVIDEIDTPEPQVMIEARIVETTKRFSRTLGVAWAFDGESSARFGNTTGLVFPNNGTANGGVNLLTGAANGFVGLTLGNVLNSFNLDVALRAAEVEGLIKILSAPKVAVLNNQQANIQSGLQIPIQTIANNTVTVQFVNATLSLDVTPHVTAEGTVLMDLEIRKREPQLAFAVQGAANAPISTKEAKTRVIVRDGGTTVIGGIYKVTSDQGTDRVPGLANVPIIGHLFKNKRRSDENEELLIFITPRVINL
ncbi:MAG TPA: type IV pilus secretin PilQ [Thermoanaerobaculia bacterium]|nr:type IV pilus secretin PilQ [Thermoanaerobaculia bacterium]